MPLVTATIEIDCPEGYEPVAFRAPKDEEFWLRDVGKIVQQGNDVHTECKRLIVRPLWQPPGWMPKGAWLFPMNSNYWCLSSKQPVANECFWRAAGGASRIEAEALAELFGETFMPPPKREPIQIK